MVSAFSVCFYSLPLLFRAAEGFIFSFPAVLGVWLHSASVLGFPTGPCKGSPVALRKPLGPRGGRRAAAVDPLPSAAGFDQFLWGLRVA